MLLVVNRTTPILNGIKLSDLTDVVRRFNPVTTERLFHSDVEDTYTSLLEHVKENLNGCIDLKLDLLKNSYETFKKGELSLDNLRYIMSLIYIEVEATKMKNDLSIGKCKMKPILVDLFPKGESIKELVKHSDILTANFLNTFELLDKGLIRVITFKETLSDYPDSNYLLLDKLRYKLRIKFEWFRDLPGSYRYLSLYRCLRGINHNILVSRKDDGTPNGNELISFSRYLDRLGSKMYLSKSKVGISIF